MATLIYLFVYGTLKLEMIERVMPQLSSCFQFVENGYVRGRLFDIVDYPGAVPSESGRVYGEVLGIKEEFAKAVLTVLDGYEDYNEHNIRDSLFRREKAIVHISETETITSFIYWYNKPTDELNEIVNGIFRSKKQ